MVEISGSRRKHPKGRVRYAVVGLGHISQAAVLPAFAHARNSELTAFVSDDPVKNRVLGRRYGVERSYDYAHYDDCLKEVDAVYIALPNHMHCEYAVRAARAGVHVLCEKPMAVTERECREMIDAAGAGGVKLMVAYRLHFEKANLGVVEAVARGKIGEPRIFNSVFCMQVREGDIRIRRGTGGGTLYDIGIYCINAARYLFRDEPFEVSAVTANGGDPRFKEVEEMTSVVLRFPNERLASFTASFGAQDTGYYDIVGTKGEICLDNAYEYVGVRTMWTTAGGKTREKTFPSTDQFGSELFYFSGCVLRGADPEPGGAEGLADVRIIEALYRSARDKKPVLLGRLPFERRPSRRQEIVRPPVRKPQEVRTQSPHL